VPTVNEPPASDHGEVTLVGGGPGAAGLLTVDACDALRDADVVYYDRLAPSSELQVLASGAELVDVGKTPYHHRFSQTQITDLLIAKARSGQSVVRLKGGDPFVFGRGSEELQACRAAGVAVRVVPGVSSAIAVPAAAGIPLTHRGISHGFTVISGHVPPTDTELAALADLARHGGTIVILMGVSSLPAITAGLRAAGLSDEVPAAVVERGYSDSQRTTHSAVGRLVHDARALDIAAPAVIVIGDVTRLGTEPHSALSGALPVTVPSAP
jgi:uroporphyrin-III C-methyltransferase